MHGADFYASKKHKGNDHPTNNPGGGGAGKEGGAAHPEGSPHSDGGKGGSLSSPSVKSEVRPVGSKVGVRRDVTEVRGKGERKE